MKMRQIKGKKWGTEIKMDKEQVRYPSFSIDIEHLPEARKWSLGKIYKIALEVKQTSLRDEKNGGSAGFDIVGIGVMDHTGKGEPMKKKKMGKVGRRYEEDEDMAM